MRAIFLLVFIGYCFPIQLQAQSQKIPVVLELFTSQGCSSCPSADKVFQQIDENYGDSVIQLAYHVDYWDRLGWKDVYGSSVFSDWQRAYGEHFKLNSIYTPQLVINGNEQLVGSHHNRIFTLIDNIERKEKEVEILMLFPNNEKINSIEGYYLLPIVVNLKGKLDSSVLKMIIIEDSLTTDISRGENSGKTLNYSNVVRKLYTVDLSEVKNDIPNETSDLDSNFKAIIIDYELAIPTSVDFKNSRFIILLQHKDTYEFRAAESYPVQGMFDSFKD